MRIQSLLSILAVAAVASAQSSAVTPAPQATGNPAGAEYIALVVGKAALRANVKAVTPPDGKGVLFQINVSGLPTEGGPFMYHLHEKPVPADGNCTGTGAHLDPYKRGEVPICNAAASETCQTGDLSGKFGNITATEWNQEYIDPFSSTVPGTPAYFGDLSIVFHLSNKTRIGCANFTQLSPGYSVSSAPGTVGPSSGLPRPSGTGIFGNATVSVAPTATGPVDGATPSYTGTPVVPTSPAQQTTNAGQQMVANAGLVLAAAAALML